MVDRAREEAAQKAAAHEAPAGGPASDIDALASNMGKLVEASARVQAAYMKPVTSGTGTPDRTEEVTQVVRALGRVAESWMKSPERAAQAQASLVTGYVDLWASTLRKMTGESSAPAQAPDSRDPRFKDPEWSTNPYFDFLKQAYLHTSRWAERMVEDADGLDPHTRHQAEFYVRQISGALSPSNFLPTNPELLRETVKQSGANLVRGLDMLAEDIEAGEGRLRIRQSDPGQFEVGVNLANTPGKVVFRNDLIELIQYAPTTETVLRRPLLIMPPWINKFYILDLNPEKSLIRWCVAQGLTVFCISWVNPDERHRDKDFAAYMNEGCIAALDAVEQATGEREATAIGYCVGGTLLSVSLAYMAAHGDHRVSSATFFTAQFDFKDAGDLRVFVDEEQIRSLEEQMSEKGYLDSAKMANSFNMLRPNDLIWPYIVNVYQKGQAPAPFDLLFWNSDSTRMPAANHSFYMRNCYLDNNLARGVMEIEGTRLDLGAVRSPTYHLAAKDDHIAPALSAYNGSKLFGGPVTYVLAGSGHIAGVVNPPAKGKYQHWTDGPDGGRYDEWVAGATEHRGSWWPHWFAWIEAQAPERVPARVPGEGKLKALCDAPGTYVLAKG